MLSRWESSFAPKTRYFALGAALMLALGSPGTVAAYSTGTTLGGTTTTVNAGAGAQTDPHIDGNLVSYTSQISGGAEIRYFNFATNSDHAIPVALPAMDYLSDVSGSTIVFTRREYPYSSIWAFDTATPGPAVELAPLVDSNRRVARIGGTTVAWQDLSLSTDTQVVSEIVTYDLVTGVSVRLTDDLLYDTNPAVSPDGNVIVWEKCATSVSPCDIWQATRTGDVWAVSQVTSASTETQGSGPDTNGTLVVYGAQRAGNATGADIYWKPIAGGAENQLALPGDQQNPNISGSVIAFEGRSMLDPNPNWDIYLYNLATSTLYRLTDTPLLDETLNDISVVGNQVRVVWSVGEGPYDIYGPAGDLNVYGYTFTMPSAPDTTPPVVTITSPVDGATYMQGQVVTPAWTATDPDDATLTTTAPATVDTSTVGTHTYTVTAVDAAGNSGTASVTYTVPFASAGIMQPVNPNGSSIFKAGSTIPLKFTLTDAAGLPATGLTPTLFFTKISNGVLGTEMEAISTSQASTGNTFRETSPGVYMFNLSTKTMASGTYQVRIDLGNGASMTGRFSLK
jgi:hypothetical protein